MDGRPANPEDQVIAYALDVPYVGQHGDDLPRWEARLRRRSTRSPAARTSCSIPEAAAAQPVLERAPRLADAVVALAEDEPVAVAVVDRRGEVVHEDAMDGAPTGGGVRRRGHRRGGRAVRRPERGRG